MACASFRRSPEAPSSGCSWFATSDPKAATTAFWLGDIAGSLLAYVPVAIGYAWAGRQLVRHYDPRAVACLAHRTRDPGRAFARCAVPARKPLWLGLHREIRHLAELASVAPFGNTVRGRMRWAMAEVRIPAASPRSKSWYLLLLLGCAVVLAYAIDHMIEQFGSALSIAAVLLLSLWIAAQVMTRGFPRGKP